MNGMSVDKTKCTGCGRCQERCGLKKAIRVDGTGKASFREDRSGCVECYHCLMICPNDAVVLSGEAAASVLRADGTASPMLTRRSCRSYRSERVEDGILRRLLQDANSAPRAYIEFLERTYVVVTGGKLRDLRSFLLARIEFHAAVFRTLLRLPFLPKAVRSKLETFERHFAATVSANRERDQLFQGAPAVVMVTGPAGNSMSGPNSDYALMQLLLLAEERGLGTCISGFIGGYAAAVSSFMGLPKGQRVFRGAMIGYPAARFAKYVRRTDTVIEWS